MDTDAMVVSILLSVTFACGLVVAGAHVINRHCIAPVYHVVANLVAFSSATAVSALLHHWPPSLLAAFAVMCWLWLARRTLHAIRHQKARLGQATLPVDTTTPPT